MNIFKELYYRTVSGTLFTNHPTDKDLNKIFSLWIAILKNYPKEVNISETPFWFELTYRNRKITFWRENAYYAYASKGTHLENGVEVEWNEVMPSVGRGYLIDKLIKKKLNG